MKAVVVSMLGLALACVIPVAAAQSKMPAALMGMRLLPGYQHRPLQGMDSVIGEIARSEGLTLRYEIGRVPTTVKFRRGGDFTDAARTLTPPMTRWYKEQSVLGEPVHLAYTTRDQLVISFPQRGVNIVVVAKTLEEVAEALLMVLTIPQSQAPSGE